LEKESVMQRSVILASVVVLAVASANCGNSDRNVLSPSSLNDSTDATAAAKGGGKGKPSGGGSTGGSGSLSLALPPYIDVNGDGLPNVGDTVTFNVSTTATDTPTVNLTCYQNGVAVFGAQGAFYASDPWQWSRYMKLYSASWGSGAADCTATLSPMSGSPILDTVRFTAGG
jgi:hypothetical protein